MQHVLLIYGNEAAAENALAAAKDALMKQFGGFTERSAATTERDGPRAR